MIAAASAQRLPVVLVVEDDRTLRTVTRRLLHKRGFEVLDASSASEAEEVAEGLDGPLDVVLMDINLPDGWGATVAQRLLVHHPDVAVVYTTGYAESDPVLAAGLADARWVIRKPYTGDELADVLRRAISDR